MTNKEIKLKIKELEEKRLNLIGRKIDLMRDLEDYDGYESSGQVQDDEEWVWKLTLEILEIDSQIRTLKALEVENG